MNTRPAEEMSPGPFEELVSAERRERTIPAMMKMWKLSDTDLTRFNKIATQGAPQMAVDKEANSLSRVYSYYSKFNLRLFYV